MEFVIHPLINYSQVAPTIRTQKAALAERLRSISNSHIIHAPLGTEGVPFVPVDPIAIEGSLCFYAKLIYHGAAVVCLHPAIHWRAIQVRTRVLHMWGVVLKVQRREWRNSAVSCMNACRCENRGLHRATCGVV